MRCLKSLAGICLCLLSIGAICAAEERYDLVIRNGRIVDGTGVPWYRGDVGIKDRRIVTVGHIERGAARSEIDAKGLVVAPGFIDIHSHSDTLLLEDGAAQSKIRQGVTTEILGEGDSVAPIHPNSAPKKLVAHNKTMEWTSLRDYFDLIEREGVSVNVGSYVGAGTVWQLVMGKSFDKPNREQLSAMRDVVRRAMADGALGMSSMLAMPPGSLATTDDMIELCREVRNAGGIYSSHIRNEGLGVFEAVQEAIEIGEKAELPVDIIHLKIADQQYWGRMKEVVGLIDAARQRGVNVQAHVYPYTRGNNDLASIIPPWAHEGGVGKMIGRIKALDTRARIKAEIRGGIPGWYNHYTAVGGDWSRMLISKETNFKGLTMDRVFAIRRGDKPAANDILDEFLDYLVEEEGRVGTVYAHHTDEDMVLALQQPWCSVGSDGSSYATEGTLRRGNPHPRSFGTFPRVLGVYVREQHLLALEDAVQKMTAMNASKLGITDRGRLLPGQFADIVVFDPDRIADRATYTEPFQYPVGISYVVVNGEIVIHDGNHTGKRPGVAIRRKS